jgi:hypothetical protein
MPLAWPNVCYFYFKLLATLNLIIVEQRARKYRAFQSIEEPDVNSFTAARLYRVLWVFLLSYLWFTRGIGNIRSDLGEYGALISGLCGTLIQTAITQVI